MSGARSKLLVIGVTVIGCGVGVAAALARQSICDQSSLTGFAGALPDAFRDLFDEVAQHQRLRDRRRGHQEGGNGKLATSESGPLIVSRMSRLDAPFGMVVRMVIRGRSRQSCHPSCRRPVSG
jgi:hypothetical protein